MAGGGIGEAMLISAAIGGGTSAITGQDPLKGALLGAALGGAGSGIGSLLGAGGGAAAGAGAGAAGGAGAGTALGIGTEAALGGLGAGAAGAAGAGAGVGAGVMPGAISAAAPAAAPAAGLGAGTAPTAAGLGAAPSATAQSALTPGMTDILSGANSMLPPASIPNLPEVLAKGATPPSGVLEWWNSLSGKEKLLYGGGAGIGALGLAGGFKQKGLKDIREPYTGPLSKFKYDPSKYDPSSSYLPIYRAAEGGIASLNSGDRIVGDPSSVDMAEGGKAEVEPFFSEFTMPDRTRVRDTGVQTSLDNKDLFRMAVQESLRDIPMSANPEYTGDRNVYAEYSTPAMGGRLAGRLTKQGDSSGAYAGDLRYSTPVGPGNAMAGLHGGYTPGEGARMRGASLGYGMPIGEYGNINAGVMQPAGGGRPNYSINAGMRVPFAQGGVADLGSYSDGGRLLKGPGDGMSDNIPATIANKRPARLADGEFVIPADVVSHLGNGSTDAGAKNLYKMMDKVRRARTGTKKQGKQINPEKYLPA